MKISSTILGLMILSASSMSHAGFLRMAGTSDLSLVESGGSLWLKGQYSIENQGDETAKDVYPTFTLDQWKQKFEAKSLGPGEKFTWHLNEKIFKDRFCHSVNESCVRALPLKGDFFLRVDKNYQDQNSYPFSTPEVLSVSLNKRTALKSARDLMNVTIKLQMIGENDFQGDYSIQNKTTKRLKLGLHFLFPKEVSLNPTKMPVDVAENGDLNGTFYFRNVTGLQGSDYLAMFVVETEADGERLFLWESTRFKIAQFQSSIMKKLRTPSDLGEIFFIAMGVLSVIVAVAIYFWWEKPRRQF